MDNQLANLENWMTGLGIDVNDNVPPGNYNEMRHMATLLQESQMIITLEQSLQQLESWNRLRDYIDDYRTQDPRDSVLEQEIVVLYRTFFVHRFQVAQNRLDRLVAIARQMVPTLFAQIPNNNTFVSRQTLNDSVLRIRGILNYLHQAEVLYQAI